MKKHYDQGDAYQRKYLIGGLVTVQGVNLSSSWQAACLQVGRHGAEDYNLIDSLASRQMERERQRLRQRQIETERQRETERERQSQRQREKERDSQKGERERERRRQGGGEAWPGVGF